jgi:hypothetical protein
MAATMLSVLMVIAVGALAGAIIGLSIGLVLGKQESEWSSMNSGDKQFNILLIVVCSIICIAGLAWFILFSDPVFV